ncbi:hypothetical protein GYMLUDRAFT_48652 [Collybiopsis luxurians FD-317 M1]|uniref:HMG box domain-containing protein n=1 Tax=Collybiopsis luxurians FD-317 M1 TaxID=944289 RepID=A0A0D0CHZ3_9AGAR|nr:hypothetical protein GYMLUDRAFT_48652 [Collybiopsis luxurians FD-317 M1]
MPAQRTPDMREHSTEVRMDAPLLPQLAIISPMPQTLTFPNSQRKCCEDRQQTGQDNVPQKKQRQAGLSKTISQKWKNLSEADQQYWEDLAKEKKRVHQEMYPGYVYRPQHVRDKNGRVRNKKYIRFHIPVALPRLSCTSSPTHLHAISRQTSTANTLFDFDYFPGSHSSNIPVNETGLQVLPHTPLWVESQADCESSQSSDLMQSLFSLPTHDLKAGQSPPPTSEESSPISGPVTPSSVLLNHPTFAQLSVFDHTLPSNFNVQIATPSDMNPKHSSYP